MWVRFKTKYNKWLWHYLYSDEVIDPIDLVKEKFIDPWIKARLAEHSWKGNDWYRYFYIEEVSIPTTEWLIEKLLSSDSSQYEFYKRELDKVKDWD